MSQILSRPPTAGNDALKQTLSLLEGRFEERSVMVAGNTVTYRTCGRGPAVVLLHGIGSGAASWLDCALRLEQHAQVIAWNAPGYGRSTPLTEEKPLAQDYALQLDGLLRVLNIDRCVLVGHSLGAMMAAAYVAQDSGRVTRLLLLSPAQGYGGEAKRARGDQVAQERLHALASLGIEGMAMRGPERLLSPHAGEAARDWVRWNMGWLNPAGYTQAVHMLCGDDIHRYLIPAAASVPATIYCGSEDVVTTPQDSHTLADEFGLPFDVVDAAGHACYIEQADAVAALIRKNLYQLS